MVVEAAATVVVSSLEALNRNEKGAKIVRVFNTIIYGLSLMSLLPV